MGVCGRCGLCFSELVGGLCFGCCVVRLEEVFSGGLG